MKTPHFLPSLICFSGNLLVIALGLFVFQISLHSLMFICLLWTGVHVSLLGYDYPSIRQMMVEGISQALPAIFIFMLIGMLIAAFMQSGTVAALIFYGLDLLSPTWFLAAGLILCSLMSVATGTSWGTAGTVGIVLIGLGSAMNIPLPLVAGMVICGATFGDKMSPVSDTTNLAAMSAGTSLFRHIGSMLYTTVPAYLLCLLSFLALGFTYADSNLPQAQISEIQLALSAVFSLNLFVTLLPLLVMLTLSLSRVSAEISMSVSIVVAVIVAVFYQQQLPADVLNSLWSNQPGQTGIIMLDELLGRGGLLSMSWTLLLSVMALGLGGMLYRSGILRALLYGFIQRLRSATALVAGTIVGGLTGNMAMGEAYISIILNSQLFGPAYEEKGLDAAVLSRSVEEGSTMTTALIPWTTAGAFYAVTLGVPVLEYLPYAFFNYLNPVVSVLMAALGVGLLKKKIGQIKG
ncbi:Na+/H+ antiporter NhaC [Pseudohongiella spirulinae]|uniref:Transporter, NhaC family n=1 Tax=Pseudohongiella spirulinae TaxID=1249552 RepID=A0A0S2KGR4_9GAMM|nr:Transporter, NhaC family [Pseudohongiella spirulinae]